MDWKKARLSDNVDMVQDEDRPYGAAEITRNLKTGAISAINPRELGIECSIALRKEFTVSALQDLKLQKNSTIPQHGLLDIDIGKNLPKATDGDIADRPVENIILTTVEMKHTEPSDCQAKVQMFRDDFEQASLGIKMNIRTSSFDQATGTLNITPAQNQFWAGKPTPPGAGKN